MSVEIILMAVSINVSMTKEVFGASAAVDSCSLETNGIVTVNSANIAFTVIYSSYKTLNYVQVFLLRSIINQAIFLFAIGQWIKKKNQCAKTFKNSLIQLE